MNYNIKNQSVKLDKVFYGTVTSGDNSSPYTTMIVAASGASVLSTVDDYYNGFTLKFTSGALSGSSFEVTDYTAASSTLVIENAGATIADGVSFELYATATVSDNLHSQPFNSLSMLVQPTTVATYDYEIFYGSESVQSGTITSLKEMVIYSDASQTFPSNNPKSNWARQDGGDIIAGYSISIKITNRSNTVTLFKVSITSQTLSNII